MGDEHFTALAMVFGALLPGDASRLVFGVAQAPIADLGIDAHRYRPAFVHEPDHHFAIVAVFAASLQGIAFGLGPVAPAVGSAIRLFGAAICDGPIVGGRCGAAGAIPSALFLVLGASTVIIISGAYPLAKFCVCAPSKYGQSHKENCATYPEPFHERFLFAACEIVRR